MKSRMFPILAVGLAMMALVSVKTGRDAAFLTTSQLEDLPFGYLLIALASIPGSLLHVNAMRRWGTRGARVRLLVLISAMFACFVPFVDTQSPTTNAILFVIVPVTFAAVFASVWLLAADLLEHSAAKIKQQTYSWMGLASMLGGISGGLFAKMLSSSLPARFLVLNGALLLAMVTLIVVRAHSLNPVRREAEKAVAGGAPVRGVHPSLIAQGFSLVRNRYVLGLIGLASLIAVCGLLIEFQFYAFAKMSGQTTPLFFANFYTLLNVVGLGVQLLAGSWLQSRFGTGVALLVLPVGLLGGAALVALNASMLTRSALRLVEGGLKSSTHRFAWEQTYLPLRTEHRDMAKALVEGLFSRVAEGLAAAAIFVWLASISGRIEEASLFWITGAITLCLIFWIYLIFYLLGKGCGQSRETVEMFRLPEG